MINWKKKYSWQKKHVENRTGTQEKYKPTKIRKNENKKNMKLGNNFIYLSLFFIFD